ncbi:hypothetical protein [Natrialbaceae archaeon AArc-T1-2]|uniref:hypothetical protein n=1 Tax=Natrialbaceae archaeon AArc-T1-2 TaxID=3053904 RepID=UPI00255A9199|nr:hypothetical protein [Natrialbaceae archaeon AArc-T1-2]WIV67644.1 hypothetical protein QQ977_02620 [Natrialbaceae archaeon AArc-T1-2]
MTVVDVTRRRTGPVVEGTVYDYLLGTIPVPLVLGAAIASAIGVSVAYGVGVGAVGSALLVAYALWGVDPTSAEPPADDGLSTDDTTVSPVADD